MSIEKVYKRGLEFLDSYYQIEEKKLKKSKRIYKYSKKKRCEFPRCPTIILVRGGGKFCGVHGPIMLKEAKRRGWAIENQKKKAERRRLGKKCRKKH